VSAGQIIHDGGLAITKGGATITEGGLTVASGGATIENGGLTVKMGTVIVEAGGVEVNAGGVKVDAGGLNVVAGGQTITGASVLNGDLGVNGIATITSSADSDPVLKLQNTGLAYVSTSSSHNTFSTPSSNKNAINILTFSDL
jgi:hypothetical protein